MGHSEGATMALIYAIERKMEADRNLIGIVTFGHIVFVQHSTSIFRYAALFGPETYNFLTSMNITGVFYKGIARFVAQHVCVIPPVLSGLCNLFLVAFNGDPSGEALPQDIPTLWAALYTGTSLKQIYHVEQFYYNGGLFRQFDYGRDNFEYYGSNTPPQYNLSAIDLPVHIFYGRNDLFTTETDTLRLYNSLSTRRTLIHISTDDTVPFNHLDFLYASEIIRYLYEPLLIHLVRDLSPDMNYV